MIPYSGNLGLNSGVAQSVYQLNTSGMHRIATPVQVLTQGQSMKLPNGAGTLTFTGYKQWISLQVTYDPGQVPALISAIVALAGLVLSFLVRRRRIFVRAYGPVPAAPSSTWAAWPAPTWAAVSTPNSRSWLAGLRSAHGGTDAGQGTIPGPAAPESAGAVPATTEDRSAARAAARRGTRRAGAGQAAPGERSGQARGRRCAGRTRPPRPHPAATQ